MDIFMKSIVGHKNFIRSQNSQDYADFKKVNNVLICTIADGHSTDFFKYSYEGAKFACKACIEVLEDYIDKSKEEWEILLSKKNIQKKIYYKWMYLVNEHYIKNNPVVYKTEYIKYSTTLLACCILDKFIITLKLGDGNIVLKEHNHYKKIINNQSEKIVNSLGRNDAYENIRYSIDDIDHTKDNRQVVLFSDGYENSFKNDKELFKSLDKTINKYKNNIFSRMLLYSKYENYLNMLSRNFSYDDISIIFIL